MFSGELGSHTLLWTFKSLNEDQELEQFIMGIPSFSGSKAIQNPQSCLARLRDEESVVGDAANLPGCQKWRCTDSLGTNKGPLLFGQL